MGGAPVARMRGESGKSISAKNHQRAAASMGWLDFHGESFPALRFLQRPA
jgi:hypothetical protein